MAKNQGVLPSAEIIAKFNTYEEAVAHVEKLLSGNFPVRQIAIVGRGIRTVERTRARISYARLALNGGINGAIVGLIFHGLLSPNDMSGYAGSMLTCAGIAALINIVRFSLNRNRRSFTTASQLVADTYEIQIPRDLKAQAEDALAKSKPEPQA